MSSYGGNGPKVNGVLWAETVLATIFVVLRIYTRKVLLRSVGWDDFFLVVSLILLVVYAIFISVASTHGLGRYRAEISSEDYIEALKYEIIGQAVCILNIAVSRAAVGFFLLRIMNHTWHRVFIWACLGTNSFLAIFATIAIFVQCVPVEKTWNRSLPGSCGLDFASIGMVCSAYAVVIDFTLAIFPSFMISGLNLKPKDKLLTMFGLGLGIFSGICGILRSVALTSLASSAEYILDTNDMLIYSGTENFVSIICASIPVLRPFYNKICCRSANSSDPRSHQLSRFGKHRGNGDDPEAGGHGIRSGANRSGGRSVGLETKIFIGEHANNTVLRIENDSEESILRGQQSVGRDTNGTGAGGGDGKDGSGGGHGTNGHAANGHEVFRHTEISVEVEYENGDPGGLPATTADMKAFQ